NATFPLVGPLVLTVQSGATLRGTIGPPAALAELRRLAGIEAGAEPTAMQWPNVCVVRDRSLSPRRFPEFRSPCGLRPDGSFELGGIPPGTWHLTVNCMKRDPNGRGGHWLEEPAGEFTLADGAITTVEVDFSRIVPGEFEGLVLHNGAPLVNTIVGVQTKLDDPTGEFTTFHEQVTTDAEGRFHATVRGGDYTLRWNRSRGERWSALQAPERAVVVAGQRTQQTFHLESGAVKLRLLDAAGSPVVGVAIELRDAAGGSRPGLPPTDADGRTEGEFDAVPMTASVLPRRLLDREALTAFYQAHRGERDPTASVRLVVGNLTPQLGQTVELELRVPAEFDR
ncbi:MAG: hypothetical protein KDE27_12000, partial [Planctomycetes bacterium]|nr:hypothetical protein [Planctomycetota bacterium]